MERRLRAFERWAGAWEGFYPSASEIRLGWNVKIPVLDRLVRPPTTLESVQRRCVSGLLRAAGHLRAAKPEALGDSVVSVLVTYPDMYFSELCVFPDRERLEGFFRRDGEYAGLSPTSAVGLADRLDVEVPDGFSEVGYDFFSVEEEDGVTFRREQQWWSYRESRR